MVEPNPVFYLIAWPLLGAVCTVIGLPLVRHALAGLPSRGLMLAKPIGWFAFTLLGWALLHSELFANGRGFASGLLWSLLAVAVVAIACNRTLRCELVANWRVLLTAEAIFLAAFWSFLVLRAFVPGVAATEAPANYGLLNTALRSANYPPADMWLAGLNLNYYYFGHAAAAIGSHAVGVTRLLAFDVALAHLFALCALTAFAIGRDLTRLRRHVGERLAAIGGLGSVVALLLTGNLAALPYLAGRAQDESFFYSGLSWNATRIIRLVDGGGLPACTDPSVIDCPITEFPVFTFLLGDLHAHALAMPLVLLAVAGAIGWYLAWRTTDVLPKLKLAVFSGAIAGLLLATNSWDFPPGLLIGPSAGALAAIGQRNFRRARQLPAYVAIVLLTAGLVALPQLLFYQSLELGLAPSPNRSQLGPFLLMWGLPLAAFFAWRTAASVAQHGRWGFIPLAAVSIAALFSEALWQVGVLAMLTGAIVMALPVLIDPGRDLRRVVLAGLAIYGLLLLMGPELLIVADGYGAPYIRMNTIFKTGFHAWTVLALIAPVAAIATHHELQLGSSGALARRVTASAVALVLAGLLAIGLGYTVNAATARLAERSNPSLNALRTMKNSLPDDVAAADWAAVTLPHDAVLLEACCRAYSHSARIANWTGIPTLLGWQRHGFLSYRSDYAKYHARGERIDALFKQLDSPNIGQRLHAEGISHVVVGQLERNDHQAVDPAPNGPLRPVYVAPAGSLTIYALPRPGPVWE